MAFLAGILPIVVVVFAPTLIPRHCIVTDIRASTIVRTVPCVPGFPPSPFYLYVIKYAGQGHAEDVTNETQTSLA